MGILAPTVQTNKVGGAGLGHRRGAVSIARSRYVSRPHKIVNTFPLPFGCTDNPTTCRDRSNVFASSLQYLNHSDIPPHEHHQQTSNGLRKGNLYIRGRCGRFKLRAGQPGFGRRSYESVGRQSQDKAAIVVNSRMKSPSGTSSGVSVAYLITLH